MSALTIQFPGPESISIILDALQDGVTVYDGDGTLVWINAKASHVLGVEREKLIGLNISDVATLPTVESITTPEFVGRSLTDLRRTMRTVDDYTSPGYMTFTNGERLLYTGNFIRNDDDTVRLAIFTIRDGTGLDDVPCLTEHVLTEFNAMNGT